MMLLISLISLPLKSSDSIINQSIAVSLYYAYINYYKLS